ncbi:MAG TPA: type I-E CRISPR-associated endonuclease Cas1e [Polyangia bacterium]|jgi:CRISPR-associated protein Cas1
MLKGRLGLETARVPHADRHGLLWLERGRLSAEDGTLRFVCAGGGDLDAGDYAIPFQMVSFICLGPGSAVTQDALRLLARHGTGLAAVGEHGVRLYASMPFGPDASALARRQALAWGDPVARVALARRMYAWRLGEILPQTDLNALRGIEGARMKEIYRRLAQQYGVAWVGRRYDREQPERDDEANQALNHAATAVQGAALLAVAATGAIPQLGFIHEDSGISFCLDVADLFRDSITVPIAFGAVRDAQRTPAEPMERIVRRLAGRTLHDKKVIPSMIDRIKEMFPAGAANPEPLTALADPCP